MFNQELSSLEGGGKFAESHLMASLRKMVDYGEDCPHALGKVGV